MRSDTVYVILPDPLPFAFHLHLKHFTYNLKQKKYSLRPHLL